MSGGNEICFYPNENVLGLHLTFEACCQDPFSGPDCFGSLGGFFSWDFCCETPVWDPCEWGEILAAIAGSTDQVGPVLLDMLHRSPVLLREFCCIVPGDGTFPCWRGYDFDSAELVPSPYVQCCQPVLRRLLAKDVEEEWMQAELNREFAPLESKRWTTKELQEFQEVHATGAKGVRPCLLSVRGGNETILHDQSECCPEPFFDCSYVLAVMSALSIIGRLKPLPDVDLLVSPSNQDRQFATVPVFTRHRPREPRSHYVLLPMEWQLSPGQARKQTMGVHRHGAEHPWETRPQQLYWRGTNSNCFVSCEVGQVSEGRQAWEDCLKSYDCETPWSVSNWLSLPRGRLVRMSQLFPDAINARWVGLSQPMDDELWSYCEESNLTDERTSQWTQAEWAFAINVDGTGSGDRVYWQMLAGCVVLIQDSPWVSWLVGEIGGPAALAPAKHYIPIRYDLMDILDKLTWLQENKYDAKHLAETSERWARKFLSYDWVLFYLDRAIRRYAEHVDATALLEVSV